MWTVRNGRVTDSSQHQDQRRQTSLHAVRRQLLRLVLTERGCGGSRRGRSQRLLDVTVAGRSDVTGGCRGGGVRVLLICSSCCGGSRGRVLGVRRAGVIQVRRGCCRGGRRLDVRDHHTGLDKRLRVHVVSRNPFGREPV